MAGDVSVLPGPSVGIVRGENIVDKGVMSGWKKGVAHKNNGKFDEARDLRSDSTYSNCSAAILLGKPVTKHVISHGRRESRDVLTAPPLDSPLCCLRRRTGLGVLPTYRFA